MAGPKSHEMMISMFRQQSNHRSWDRAREEQNNNNVSGFYPQYPPLMTAMQQSNYHNAYNFPDSTASTSQASATEPSSSENRVATHFETIPPPFIDFLGVGAT